MSLRLLFSGLALAVGLGAAPVLAQSLVTSGPAV